ncbi:MAG TPA: class I SAM-dependent methyltransferase [Gammaproteobacteria bacterium]|jgi:SAM-dependent methyltransferase|nr:class I SAM-dependent methyltransferase [Gammaproteobacteria bacterium]
MKFKDHFSGHAALYTRYRPTYPDALYAFLARLAPANDCAWDCATGNGQAARGLARHFRRVIATDASAEQIANAQPDARVEYRVAPARGSSLDNHSVALVTVAQALHWFDVEQFYAEVRRVLAPRGIVAVWSYALMKISPAIDAVVLHLYGPITGAYWPPERRHTENGYADLPFPFEPVQAPAFAMTADWDFAQLAGYLRTWSGVQRYLKATGRNPVGEVEAELRQAWGDADAKRRIEWPLTLKVGRAG